MGSKPVAQPLPANLPEDWQANQIVSPGGTEAGLDERHGYNYQARQINAAQRGVNAINEAFADAAVSYYKVFTAADWSGGKLVLPGSAHSIRGTAVFCQVSVLSGGGYVLGTWAGMETYATIDAVSYDITLHYGGTAYAGAVLVVG